MPAGLYLSTKGESWCGVDHLVLKKKINQPQLQNPANPEILKKGPEDLFEAK